MNTFHGDRGDSGCESAETPAGYRAMSWSNGGWRAWRLVDPITILGDPIVGDGKADACRAHGLAIIACFQDAISRGRYAAAMNHTAREQP